MEGTSRTRSFCQDWDEHFMTFASLSAKLSRNIYPQVGVYIVNNKKEIVSTGYNGILRKGDNNKFYWHRDLRDLNRHSFYMPHAEVNALRNKTPDDLKNCTMYVTFFPCNKCTKKIINSGLKTVIYLNDNIKEKTRKSKMMFDAAGVTYRPKQIKIDFSIKEKEEVKNSPSSVLTMEGPWRTTRRTFCQDWDEYFMTKAFLYAKLSRNHVQIGVCIANNKKEIVSTGYNGMPRECDENKFYWHTDSHYSSRHSLYALHAEANALYNKNSDDLKDCTMYVTLFPCSVCAKKIIESGIKTVVYLQDKINYKSTSKMMFDAAGVTYRLKKIEINFSISERNESFIWNQTNQLSPIPMGYQDLRQQDIINILHYIILNMLFNNTYFTF